MRRDDAYQPAALARRIFILGLTMLLAACATAGAPPAKAPPPSGGGASLPGTYKVGTPYRIDGKWYYPKEQPDYSETGIASWYGPGFHGRATANGERFDENDLTAAHTTLPMPVNVRVTNLENGRTLVLRVNDRGPFKDDRIIDVSRRAAELLGFKEKGTAKVRVDFIGMPGGTTFAEAGTEGAPPAASGEAGRADEGILPSESAAPTVPSGHYFVQIGAFTLSENAVGLYNDVAGIGPAEIAAFMAGERKLYRVRIGPVASENAAEEIVANLASKGHTNAKIVID